MQPCTTLFFRRFTSLLAGALLMLTGSLATAATTAYVDGDVFLGFRATGGAGVAKDYLVNLGPISQFETATSVTALSAGNIAADLSATFGSDWATRTDLLYSVIGGTVFGTASDPENTIIASNPATTPWARGSDGAQSSLSSRIAALGDFYETNASTANNDKGLVQDAASTNSYFSFQPSGTQANSSGISFAFFNPSIEGAVTTTLNLNRLTPSSQAAGKITLGAVSISAAGVVTFTPTSAGPSVHFTSATNTVGENGTQATISITRDAGTTAAFSVQVNSTNGTAVAGTDFTGQSGKSVDFAANQNTATLNVPVVDRAGFQGSRAFTLTLSNPSNNGAVVAPASTVVTITDDDPVPPGVLAFAKASVNLNAVDGSGNPSSINVQVTRTGGSGGAVSATVGATSANLSGTDFTAPATVSFADGVTTANVTIQLGTITPSKLPASIVLTLSAPTGGATLGAQDSTTVNVVAAGLLTFSTAAVTVSEGASDVPVTITVNRLGGSVGAVTVQVSPGGTATNSVDYTLPSTPVTLSWANGETAAKTFTLTVKTDALTEGAETAILTLQNPTGSATIGAIGVETVTIVPPDAVPPTVTIISPKANAKPSGATLAVTGNATDDNAISRVEVKVNGTLAATQNAPANTASFDYTANIVPENGNNTIEVTAFDLSGNASTAVTRTIKFTLARPTLAGRYNGLIVAVNGGDKLANNGLLALTVTSSGSFTGKATLRGTSFALKGKFLVNGTAVFGTNNATSAELKAKVNGVSTVLAKLALTLDTANGHKATGTIKSADETQTLANIPQADQALYTTAKTLVAPFIRIPSTIYDPAAEKGKYTGLFITDAAPNNGHAADEFPQGDGWVRITVSAAGAVKFTGKTADGQTISYSNYLSSANQLPFFLQLYGKKGIIGGTLNFDPTQAQSDINGGNLIWIKPDALPNQTTYPNGWDTGINVDFVGSKFLVKTLTVLGPTLAAATDTSVANIDIQLADGGLANILGNDASIDAKSKVKVLAATTGLTAADGLKVTFVSSTGALSGSFTHPASSKTVKFTGVAFQKTSSAGGYFLYKGGNATTSVSGGVSVTPTP